MEWFAFLGVEIGQSTAFMASAGNGHSATPEPQIGAFADALPEASGFPVSVRLTLFELGFALNQPITIFMPSVLIRWLAIQKPFAANERCEMRHACAVRHFVCAPTEGEFIGVFRKMFTADMVPCTVNTTF